MLKVELPRRFMVGFAPFKWGVIFHFRFKLKWWHLKIACWRQFGNRVSTRHQRQTLKRQARYVTVYRLHVSFWRSTQGHQGKPRAFGIMFYAGGGHHRNAG